MSTSLTTRLSRLADHLGDLRLRLQEAARHEVGHAIADALAEATRALIIGRDKSRPTSNEESPPWDDPWYDDCGEQPKDWTDSDRLSVGEPNQFTSNSRPYEAALMSGLAVARWSLGRTAHPAVAVGLATTVAIIVLVAGDRFKSLAEILAIAQELLAHGKRPT